VREKLYSLNESVAHHRAESSGIADVSKVEYEVNVPTIHLLEDHVSGVEGVGLDVIEEKKASILLTTTHICREKKKVTYSDNNNYY
jgi:hypothetical protein